MSRKARLIVVDEIDLVDCENDVAHAEQRHDDRMAMGLREQPFARVDEHDREVGVGSAGGHVARILLVARRVGDDERAPRCREVAIGDVDRDALLTLGFEPVDQERVVDIVPGRPEFFRIPFERRQLVVEDQFFLVQHSPDEGRLAVVDRSAGEQTQGREGHLCRNDVHRRPSLRGTKRRSNPKVPGRLTLSGLLRHSPSGRTGVSRRPLARNDGSGSASWIML